MELAPCSQQHSSGGSLGEAGGFLQVPHPEHGALDNGPAGIPTAEPTARNTTDQQDRHCQQAVFRFAPSCVLVPQKLKRQELRGQPRRNCRLAPVAAERYQIFSKATSLRVRFSST